MDEERWHRPLEPVEEPDWCSTCGEYGHNMLDCTYCYEDDEWWDDEDEDDE